MGVILKARKHYFIFLICLLMAVGQYGITGQDAVYADSGDVDVLAFTSDVHNDQKNYTGETRLGTWIDNVVSQYGKIDAMAFAGDMAQYNSADAKFWSETQRVMNVVEGKGIAAYYTTGNHEYDHDSSITNDFYPDKNETTRKYIQNDWAVSDTNHNYRIYCLGVGEASGSYNYVENAYTTNQVNTLRDKLAAVDNSRPIFIITHFPLHYNGSRTITNASNIIDVLNNAATGGTPDDPSDDKKIVFLWGHNHSMSSPLDAHYDTIYQKGSSLQYDSSHNKELQFLYAAAGAMCDTEKDSASGKIEGKGLVATVNSNDLITLSYHKADGTTVTKNGGPFEETEPVAVERFMIDEADQSGLSVEVGCKLQLNTTVMPEEAKDYTVTWSSSDDTVATVDGSGKVTGVSEGQAEITATLDDSVGGNTHTASVDIQVVPRTTSGTPYVLTNQLTPGKNYLIVSANSGEAYALMNDNGTLSKATVNIEGDTIYTDNEDIVFEAQGSGTTINDLHNGDRYLKAHSDGLELLEVAGTTRPWEYNSSNHSLRNFKSGTNPSYYYVYYENDAFTRVKGTAHAVYIFEETELPEDVTYDVTFKVKNGKWDDGTSTDKTVHVTGPEGSLTLDESQIPAVGSKPNSGYKAGSWNETPDTRTPLTGNITYTYTYAEQEQTGEKAYVLTDELTPGKNYIISSANSGTAKVLTSKSTTAAEVTIDGDTIYTDDSSIVFKMGETGGSVNYIGNEDGYVNHTSDNYLEFVSTRPSGITWTYDGSYLKYESGGATYYLYYKSGTNYNRYRIKNQSSASTEQLVYLFEETVADEGHNMVHHEATEATCTQNGNYEYWSCDHCGKFFADESGETEIEENSWVIEAKGHDYHDVEGSSVAATCTKDGKEANQECSRCHDVIEGATIPAKGHKWDKGTVTTDPTCTAKGVKTFECENCHDTRTEDINALGHNMDAHAAVAATCTKAGNSAYWSCDRCNKFFSDENGETEIEENSWVIAAKGHDYQTVEGSTVAATCTKDGKEADQKCSRCDDVIEGAAIKALGHNMANHEAKEPTCAEDGNYEYWSCDRCSKFFADEDGNREVEEGTWIIPAGHDWSKPTYSWSDDNRTVEAEYHCMNRGCTEEVTETVNTDSETTEPTCTEAGKITYTAEFEDRTFETQTKEVPIPAKGHDWSKPTYKWSDDYRTVTGEYHCTEIDCDEEVTETVNTTSETTEPTCTEAGKITYTAEFEDRTFRTQIEEEEIEALGHDYQAVEDSAVAATCIKNGKEADQECSRCHDVIEGATIPAKGHKWNEGTVTTEPTCTAKGVKTFECENCHDTRTEDINALGHNMDEHAAVAATCTKAGNSAYWSCDRCNKFFSDKNGETEIEENSWIIPTKGHKWDKGTVTTEPTCTAKGVRTFECENCHDTRTEDINALGHNMDAHAAVAATCTKAGNSAYWSCDRCNKFFSDKNGETEIEENSWIIPAKGHKWDEGTVTTEPTCTAKGVKTFACENCDATRTEDVDALGHNMDAHAAVAATCTKAGNSAYWSCDRCNKFFSDKNGETEIEENSWTIPATGHKWDKGTVTTEPTCTAKGVKTFECENCRDTRTEDIDALGHNMSKHEAKEATCTAAGNSAYWSCDHCNKFFSDENGETEIEENSWIIEAKGHKWDKGTVTTEPTCTAKGVKTFACENCHDTRTEDINALGHNMSKHEAKEATCTAAGNSAYWSCDRCNKFFSDKNGETEIEENSWIIPAKGHKWNKGTVTTEPTCTAKGVKTFECENCHDTRMEDINALGHNMDAHAAVAATCTAAGNSAYYSCDRCHKYFSDEDGEHEVTENSWVIEAKGHDYQTVEGSAVAATCTKDGKEANQECSRCHDVIEGATIPATGHKWDEGVITKEPTTTATGIKTYICEYCGVTKDEVLPKKATANKPLIVANGVAKGKTSLKLSWNNVYETSRYIVYMAPGKKAKFKKVATLNSNKLNWTRTKLKKNKVYKFKVVAQKKVNGKYQNIDTSLVGYAITGGVQGKFTNPKSLKINRSTITLAKGKTFKVKCTVTKLKKSKKLATKYASKLRYRTSNSKVATVTKSGKITAKGKGSCTIYIQTINGIWKTCHVTVR